ESDRALLSVAAAPSSNRSTGPVESKRANGDLGATGSKTSLAVTAQSANGEAFARKPADPGEVSSPALDPRPTSPLIRRWGLFVAAAAVLAVAGTALILASRHGRTPAGHAFVNETVTASAPPSSPTVPSIAAAETAAPAVATASATAEASAAM